MRNKQRKIQLLHGGYITRSTPLARLLSVDYHINSSAAAATAAG